MVVVCAVEGTMPQTETVLRQALKEKVKPVLFINKTDRLINELQVDAEQMQQRLIKIIAKVNGLIEKYAPEEHKQDWQVSIEAGTVAIGSAFHNWAISFPFMKKTGMSFKDIFDHCHEEKQKELAKKLPTYEVLLDMVTKHLPNPKEAQKYRIPKIWEGDKESDIGKSMVGCDKNGKTSIMITSISVDPHAGEIATGRIYSGKVNKGDKLHLINSLKEATVQQVNLFMSAGRIQIPDASAGNIISMVGLKDAFAGETAASEKIEPFESIKHYSEPVITKSIEAKNPKDLPKLIEALRQVAKEDSTVRIDINQETGEHLLSGMGELHLEILEHVIRKDKKVDIITSQPIVVYRESVAAKGAQIEGKSPNHHNKIYFVAEPITDEFYNMILEGDAPDGKIKKMDPKLVDRIVEATGLNRKEVKKMWFISNNCVLIDRTKGIQHLFESRELITQAFKEAINNGPLAKEKCNKVMISLMDAKFHEDAIHRGPAQLIPAVRMGVWGAMLTAKAYLMEPMQKLFINIPQDYMGSVTTEIQTRRGQIINTEVEDSLSLTSKVPVAQMFGFAGSIRSATQGRALWSTEYAGYEKLPASLQEETILSIRKRKGMPEKIPKVSDFIKEH